LAAIFVVLGTQRGQNLYISKKVAKEKRLLEKISKFIRNNMKFEAANPTGWQIFGIHL